MSMFGDSSEALESLRRSEEKLRAYGESRGLVLREEKPWPGYVPAAQQPGPVKHAIWSLAGDWMKYAGSGLPYNNHYAGIALGPDGTTYLGVIGGLMALRDG